MERPLRGATRMRKSLWIVCILLMLLLSLMFLGWSGLVKMPSLGSLTSFPHVRSLYLNRKANVQFLVQNYPSAFDDYVKVLEFDPFAAEIHLDLGLTYEAQQQAEKAQQSYQNSVLYSKDEAVRFMGLFNGAQLMGKAKKVDQALELYQQALSLNPSSKEVKTNIELLIQQQQQDQKQDDKDQKDKDQKDQKDKKDQKDQKDNKDQKKDQGDKKDQKDQGQGQNEKDKEKDPKDQQGQKEKEQPKEYGKNPKPQPKKFDSKDLSEGDVKKILQELKQQEQKIRAEFNRKDAKEQPRDKDW
jgi:Ca-activated chloride channel family protein